jgi:hypothetical protein
MLYTDAHTPTEFPAAYTRGFVSMYILSLAMFEVSNFEEFWTNCDIHSFNTHHKSVIISVPEKCS